MKKCFPFLLNVFANPTFLLLNKINVLDKNHLGIINWSPTVSRKWDSIVNSSENEVYNSAEMPNKKISFEHIFNQWYLTKIP